MENQNILQAKGNAGVLVEPGVTVFKAIQNHVRQEHGGPVDHRYGWQLGPAFLQNGTCPETDFKKGSSSKDTLDQGTHDGTTRLPSPDTSIDECMQMRWG